uniref:C-type lectin domain-containing protein n=1 Tax=Pygocentrus nattereri TaxID=42514 RepID=A0A3B4C0A0_PYGNA
MLTRAFISTALWTLSFCGTRQFHVVNEKMTWTNAQKYCKEKFTDLATIESQEEMNALLAVLNGKTGYFWIGLSQKKNVKNTVSRKRTNHDFKYIYTKLVTVTSSDCCYKELFWMKPRLLFTCLKFVQFNMRVYYMFFLHRFSFSLKHF